MYNDQMDITAYSRGTKLIEDFLAVIQAQLPEFKTQHPYCSGKIMPLKGSSYFIHIEG